MTAPTQERMAYTPEEARHLLGGIPYRTVVWLINNRKLGARKAGRYWLIPREEIERYLEPAIRT